MKLSIWVRQVSTQQQLLDLLNSYGYCLTKASFTALPFLLFHFLFLSCFSLRKQSICRDASNSFPAKWRLRRRNSRRNSILMTCHCTELMLKICFNQSEALTASGSDTSSAWNFCARSSDIRDLKQQERACGRRREKTSEIWVENVVQSGKQQLYKQAPVSARRPSR